MRIFNTIKNSLYAIVSYCILAILALLVRKVFLLSLPVEMLGYEGLFGNVFALLALADLGMESLILYRLFPAFADKNNTDINKIMSVYKMIYKYVGLVILVLGVLLIPFLRIIIKDNDLPWNYVYFIYAVQLIITLCTYFLAYKRLMFTVSQQEYICTKVDTYCSFTFNIVKIAVLLIFKSYVLYLVCNLCTNVISNIIISKKVDSSFDFFDSKQNATIKDIKSLGIGLDIKNNIVQKICGTIYGGTDNIVVSAFLGISQVGLLSNYTLIQSYVTSFFTKLLKPFQMSIGNYIYSNDKDSGLEMFRMFDLISFFLASVISINYYCLFNPFITLWVGEKYLLDMTFVFAFSANQYILWNHQFLFYYRSSFGRYELDKFPAFLAALLNVVLSIILCKYYGIAGVMIGTVIGHLGLWFGRVRVVYTEYLEEKLLKYIGRQIIRLCVWICEMIGIGYICNLISISPLGIIIRILICTFITCLLNFIVFINTKEMKSIICYIEKTVSVLKDKNRGLVK